MSKGESYTPLPDYHDPKGKTFFQFKRQLQYMDVIRVNRLNREFREVIFYDWDWSADPVVKMTTPTLRLYMLKAGSEKIIACADILTERKTIEQFEVETNLRNQGYGEKFLRFCIAQYGIDNINVVKDNYRALHLYEKCGFKVIGSIDNDTFHMKLIHPKSTLEMLLI
ncbi:MAG: GNAT family N-acetyltransferase [Lachnospiraceae bacterium]|nr:GNAT family N-acetyltransferase [Lachnospiraceae bacterium]